MEKWKRTVTNNLQKMKCKLSISIYSASLGTHPKQFINETNLEISIKVLKSLLLILFIYFCYSVTQIKQANL